MSSNQYTRERKEDKPVLAICYDFDKTLSPDDMQAQGYIQSVGYDVGEFWTESNGLASQNDMDQNLAYMLLMKKKAAGKLVLRVPFRNMVYIGDSDTDIPCMKLVNTYGGHSIGVYSAVTHDKAKVYKMMRDNRIRYYAMADYLDGAELDELIKAIIDRTAKNEALESKFFDCKNEQIRVDRQNSDDQKEKIELLIELESSRSFASTHAAVEKMRRVDTWTQEEREAIFEIALSNSQVRYIIGDLDVKMFYLGLLRNCQSLSEKAMEVKAMLEG